MGADRRLKEGGQERGQVQGSLPGRQGAVGMWVALAVCIAGAVRPGGIGVRVAAQQAILV